MWITQAIEKVKEAVEAAQEPLANEQECKAYAAAAYDYCVSLYGPPADAERPYSLVRGTSRPSQCCYALGSYVITLSSELNTLEQQCTVIGHEMYHRVTMHRGGLRRKPWIDEMLAILTSLWFLHQQGFSSYAEFYSSGVIASPDQVDLNKVYHYQRPLWHHRMRALGELAYPGNFGAGVGRIAVALKQIVDGNNFCRILKAETLEEWIASLPPENQYGVCKVLEIPTADRHAPETGTDLSQLRKALTAKGSPEAVVAEFQQIARLQPENGAAFFYLGRACEQAQQLDMALDAYLQANALNFSDAWLPFNIGGVYWHRGERESAAPWFRKAVECKPEWAQAHYFLGMSLNAQGNIGAARNSWEKVLTLGDEHYTKLAQEELAENPLPSEAV